MKVKPIAIIDATDKEAWHGERARGVTKTDMRRLISGTKAAFREVWESKNGGKRFKGNKYTQRGHDHEGWIADAVHEKVGIAPSQILYASGIDARKLATPDCYQWTDGEGELVEIKTTQDDWSKGLPRSIVRDVLWQKWVLGAGWAAVAWVRFDKDGMPLSFEPEIIEVPDDPDETARLLAAADAYLAWVDAGRPDDDSPVPVEYRDLIERHVAAKAEMEATRAQLEEWVRSQPDADTQGFKAETPAGRVSLIPVTRSEFDKEKAAEADPDLIDRWTAAQKTYRRERRSSRFEIAAPKTETKEAA